MYVLDAIDRRIIFELQKDARISNQELAERVDLSPSPCLRRVRRLEEEGIITGIMQNIQREYQSRIDQFTQNIIIGQLELLLNYSDRFYQRQFTTRNVSSHDILSRFEDVLTKRFESGELSKKGLPAVSEIAAALNLSPNYLSGLLKTLTGKSTQHHLHDMIIEKAKEKLSGTNSSVSEIAYELGFDYPQSFSKLFKANTKLSPGEFRQSFN